MQKHNTHFKLFLALICMGIITLTSCEDENKELTSDISITLERSQLFLEKGSSERLVASIVPSDAENTAHVWSSESPQIASVDETGLVTAHKTGKTKIVARLLANNATAVSEVTVVDKIVHVQSIQLNTTDSAMAIGDVLQLSATITPANATDRSVDWTSSNTEIAAVDDNGLVKALAYGNVIITAKTSNNNIAKCNISVREKGVEFNDFTYSPEPDGTVTITGTIVPLKVSLSEIGICYSKTETPNVNSSKIIISTNPESLKIHGNFGNFEYNTKYYIRTYALSGSQPFYSKTEEIVIPQAITTNFKLLRTVLNKDYTCDLYFSTPDINGIDKLNICYGLAPCPEITDFTIQDCNPNSILLTHLTYGKKYYLRAYTKSADNVVKYYQKEFSAETFGLTYHLIKQNKPVYIGYWGPRLLKTRDKLEYILPEGNYKVTYEFENTTNISITKDLYQENFPIQTTIYVKGGKGHLYLYYSSTQITTYKAHGFPGTITFKDMETGLEYVAIFPQETHDIQ